MNEDIRQEAPAQTPPQTRLVIVMDQQGRFGVNGPIDNMMLCYGLLEMAKDAIRAHHEQKRRVDAVPFMPPGLRQ